MKLMVENYNQQTMHTELHCEQLCLA